jgi:hypothetical protein
MDEKLQEQMAMYAEQNERPEAEKGNVQTIEAQPVIPQAKAGFKKTEKAIRIEQEVDRMGYHLLPIKTLPTGGLFYPEGTEVLIRAARGEEIKHWSTMDDTELENINAVWNFIIEKCVVVRGSQGASWRDLKEIDKLYITLAIRELTFVDDENNLTVSVSEGKDVPITKEMVHYVEIPREIMEHYDKDERCFIFRIKKSGRVIKMYIPSFGVSEWLTNYFNQKVAEKTGFDLDFIQMAPMLIPDYRNLSRKSYEDLVMSCSGWGVDEWSVVSYVIDVLKKTLQPTFKYKKEDGTEVEVPVTFRGGVKAIFTVSNPLSLLC